MEMYNNALCISPQELTGIVSLSALQKMIQRGQVQQVRRACYGSCALYVVESLPVQYRAEVYRRYPDLKEQAESKPFVEAIEPYVSDLNGIQREAAELCGVPGVQ